LKCQQQSALHLQQRKMGTWSMAQLLPREANKEKKEREQEIRMNS